MMNLDVRSEPRIIQFGRYEQERKYPVQDSETEFRASLKRAFTHPDNPEGIIRLDSNMHGQTFLAACAAWALDQEVICYVEGCSDGQSEIYYFRLTDHGKQEILGQ